MWNKAHQCHTQPFPTTNHKDIKNQPGLPPRAIQLFSHIHSAEPQPQHYSLLLEIQESYKNYIYKYALTPSLTN